MGTPKATATALLSRLPRCTFAFAYGSAVKQQNRTEIRETPMMDLGVCIAGDSGREWHLENLSRNPCHYSVLGRLGPNFLNAYQRRYGARVYFNTLVPAPDLGVLFKYGVVDEGDLLADLLDWTHLYYAGRLHKPVDAVVAPDSVMESALKRNLLSAVEVSLLLLPRRFTRFRLFHTISNLSYSGDFRMIFGENKDKVANIVNPRLDEFDSLYEPALFQLRDRLHRIDEDVFEFDNDPETKRALLSDAPSTLKAAVFQSYEHKSQNENDALLGLVLHPNFTKIVENSIRSIVLRSSISQSIKGIFTAGMLKSLRYSGRKIKKMF